MNGAVVFILGSHHREWVDVVINNCWPSSSFSIFKSYVTLFWSLFGLTQLSTVREGDTQPLTKLIGEYMLMVYHAMAVIVLINMLIAMMSNSFQEIEVIAVIVCYNGQSFRLSLPTNPSLTTTVDEHRNTTTPLGGAPLWDIIHDKMIWPLS